MIHQVQTLPKIVNGLFAYSLRDNFFFNGQILASAQDFGYEIAEEELASGLASPLPDELEGPAIPEVDPDDFETAYQWFLS